MRRHVEFDSERDAVSAYINQLLTQIDHVEAIKAAALEEELVAR